MGKAASFSSVALATWLLFLSYGSSPVTAFQQHATSLSAGRSFTVKQNCIYRSNASSADNLRRRRGRHSLTMHMGHSHSHHHHHDHKAEEKVKSLPTPTTLRGKILHQFSRRGKTISILFAAAATLLPMVLFRHRNINRTDIALFAITSTVLSFADKMRRETKYFFKRAKGIRDGLIKHAPPQLNPSKFLFQNDNAADRVTLVGVVVNLLLSVGKGFIGLTCNSSALVADAGHSLSDLFSDFITLWAVQIARLPPDDDHPYGHGKFEAVGSLFLAFTLFATGLSVGASSNSKLLHIISQSGAEVAVLPTLPALIMAFLSIVSKEWLYRITRKVGEQINSQVVIANAWHHRSDAYSSILAMGSIGLAMSVPGMAAADAAAGLLVAGMICMTGAEIMGEAVKQLTDTSDNALVERVKALALESSDDVTEVKRIRARWMGSSAIVDLAVSTSENLSSSANRAVEEKLRFKIMEEEPGVIDADVHATSSSLTCPLLTATGVHEEMKSVQEVEEGARLLLLAHDEVQTVEGCTVHYQDTLLAKVNANIKLKSQNTTIDKAESVAVELKKLLEGSEHIHSASIFLDLNPTPVRHRNMIMP